MSIELRKASFHHSDDITLEVSSESFKVVHIASQSNLPTIWYETVSNPIMTKKVSFKLVRSSCDIPDKAIHVGAAHCDYEEWGGEVVWHIYQLRG
jgi:hypothetical protein